MSAKYRLPVPVFHFWPKLTHPAARCRGLSAIAELIVVQVSVGRTANAVFALCVGIALRVAAGCLRFRQQIRGTHTCRL